MRPVKGVGFVSTGSIAAVNRGRAALLFIGMLLIGANLRAAITSVGPVLGELSASTGLSSTTAGLLVSLPVLAFAAFSPFAPGIAVRFGLERTLWAALVILAAAIVARSVPVPGTIWAGTVVLGAAIAFLNVLLPSLVKREFPARVSTATGAYSIVQGLVAALSSGLAVPIAGVGEEGWRIAIGIWAGLALIAAAVLVPLLRRDAPRRGAERLDPTAGRETAATPGRTGLSGLPWRSALAWQITAFLGLQSFLFYTVVSWLPLIEQSFGVPAADAGWSLFLYQLVSVAAMTVTPSAMHRRPDQVAVGLVGSLLGLVGVVGLLFAPALLVAWVVALGLSSGSMILLALSLFGLRTRQHHRTAALSGMAQTIGYLLAAIGPLSFGALHDVSGGWTIPLGLLAVLLCAQCVAVALAGRNRYVD